MSNFSFTHKVCPICKINKPVEAYNTYFSKKRNKHRIGNYCKPCAKENSRKRSAIYFIENKEERLQYAKKYRSNPENKEKIKFLSKKFKIKYSECLKDCYVRDRLSRENNISQTISKEYPELVETKRLQIKIKRKLKSLKNGKK